MSFLMMDSDAFEDKVNGHELEHIQNFHLNIRKNFIPAKVLEPRVRLPREVVNSHLERFQTHLDIVILDNLLCMTLLELECWTR